MFAGFEKLLADAIRRGQRAGEIASSIDAAALARGLRCMLDGIAVLQKAGASRRHIEVVVTVALRLLPA